MSQILATTFNQSGIIKFKDGTYHPKELGFDHDTSVMCKDQRNVGKSCIKTSEIYFAGKMLLVKVKDNKPVEGLIDWVDKLINDPIATIAWKDISLIEDCGKGKRKKNKPDRYTPNISSEEQVKKELKGKGNYQKCAKMIWTCINNGDRNSAGVVFGYLTDDDHIEDLICTCRGNVELMYVTLLNKPHVFKHMDISAICDKLAEQEKIDYTEME